MKALSVLLCLSLLFMLTSVALAQESTPAGDPKDNVCYEGGMWDDGRCNIPPHVGSTELAWECGWYMARILDGRLPVSAMPTACTHVLTRGQVAALAAPETPMIGLCELWDDGEGVVSLICLFGDGTGIADYGDDGTINTRFIFQDSDSWEDCPADFEVEGEPFVLMGMPKSTTSFESRGFTSDQLFVELSLPAFYCQYVWNV